MQSRIAWCTADHASSTPSCSTKTSIAVLEEVAELAPLHNRPALEAIGKARNALPDVPHVAVFDTAFHRTMPDEASTYAVPREWHDAWGIRRYGFHGLSVQWASEQVPVPRLVVCHLGGGCSITAVQDGRSIDTTMGYSPLDGIPMATRSGSVDPEIVLHLIRTGRLDVEGVRSSARVRIRPARRLGRVGPRRRAGALDLTLGDARARGVHASHRCRGRRDDRLARRNRCAGLHSRGR